MVFCFKTFHINHLPTSHTLSSVFKHSVCYIIKKASFEFANFVDFGYTEQFFENIFNFRINSASLFVYSVSNFDLPEKDGYNFNLIFHILVR